MLLFSFIGQNQDSSNVNNVARYELGTTVFVGEDVIDESNINKYPIATNIDYLVDRFKTLDFIGAFSAITSGTVHLPISELSAGGISDSGIGKGFSGPWALTKENNKRIVKAPDNFV